MITGAAANQTYSIQYAITYEYVSASNTDLVPHKKGAKGEATKIIADHAHNNPCDPVSWTKADSKNPAITNPSGFALDIGGTFKKLGDAFSRVRGETRFRGARNFIDRLKKNWGSNMYVASAPFIPRSAIKTV